MQKRTEITIETERFLVVSRHRERTILWCNQCAKDVPMVTVDEAASTFRMAEACRLHFARTPEGRLFICSNSLASAQERSST
jgi:hypothetical protein